MEREKEPLKELEMAALSLPVQESDCHWSYLELGSSCQMWTCRFVFLLVVGITDQTLSRLAGDC